MKKLITFMLAALTCISLTACAPADLDKAEAKMEKAGYTVIVEDTLSGLFNKSIVGTIVATKSGDALTATLFEDIESAKEYHEKLVDQNKDKEDQVVKRSGKWVFVGTEDAIEDFTKLF